MKRYLLDTNICVRFMRQKFGVDEHIEKVGWEHCCISEVTVAELLFGAERSNNVERNLAACYMFLPRYQGNTFVLGFMLLCPE